MLKKNLYLIVSLILVAYTSLTFAQSAANQVTSDGSVAAPDVAKIQSVEQLLALAQQYEAQNKHADLVAVFDRVLQLRPHAGIIRYEQAAAYAQLDDKSKVYDTLVNLKDQGYGFAIESDSRFSKSHGTEVWTYLVEQMQKNRTPAGEGKVMFTAEGKGRLPQSLAYDRNSKQFLLGSTREAQIYRVDSTGKASLFIAQTPNSPLAAPLAMAVDAKRNILWVASSGTTQIKNIEAKKLGRTAILKYDLKTGKFLAGFPAPAGNVRHEFIALTLAADGTLYAIDAPGGAVLRISGDKMNAVIVNPQLTDLRGLAVSEDGKFLYLADFELGLLAIDLNKGSGHSVGGPKKFSQYGISSLAIYQGHLLAVQSGFEPQRIVRMRIVENGLAINNAQVLDVENAAWDSPQDATVVGDQLFVIANSQSDSYDSFGIPRSNAKLEDTRIFASKIRFKWADTTAESLPSGPIKVAPVGHAPPQ